VLAGRVDDLERRLTAGLRHGLALARGRSDSAARALNAVSPLATLGRGYAIATRVADGTILTDAAKVETGEEIRLRLGRGSLRARTTGREN
jgi:exodeoxyribonuclease VII large subunit